MGDNRPDVYVEDGTVVYRASSLGMCVRALVAIGRDNYQEAMGKERIDLLERSADEGNLHEDAVRQKLVREGWKLVSAQDEVNIPIIKGVIVRGHTDGVLIPPDDDTDYRPHEHLLEVKSMSNKRFDRWTKQGFDGFLKYAYQISSYMQANPGRDVIYIIKRREDGFENRFVIPADSPPISWKHIRTRILTAERHRRKRASFPECDLTSQERFWCPFFYLHDEEDPSDGPVEMTDEDKAVLADMIPKRMELKAIENAGKQAEEDRKILDKEILNLMGATEQLKDFEAGDETYLITQVNGGGERVDLAKLRADFGEDLTAYMNPYRFTYPKITRQKKKPK